MTLFARGQPYMENLSQAAKKLKNRKTFEITRKTWEKLTEIQYKHWKLIDWRGILENGMDPWSNRKWTLILAGFFKCFIKTYFTYVRCTKVKFQTLPSIFLTLIPELSGRHRSILLCMCLKFTEECLRIDLRSHKRNSKDSHSRPWDKSNPEPVYNIMQTSFGAFNHKCTWFERRFVHKTQTDSCHASLVSSAASLE